MVNVSADDFRHLVLNHRTTCAVLNMRGRKYSVHSKKYRARQCDVSLRSNKRLFVNDPSEAGI